MFSGKVSLIYFFPSTVPYFCFFVCLDFVVVVVVEPNNEVTMEIRFSPSTRVCSFSICLLFLFIFIGRIVVGPFICKDQPEM